MNDARLGWRFSLRDLIAVVAILCVLCALSTPLIASWRENSRREQCINLLKIFGLGCQNFENANKRFLLASDYEQGLVVSGKNDPGLPSARAHSGGYSWMVMFIPNLESSRTYSDMSEASNKFQVEPFATQCRNRDGNCLWQQDIAVFHCPSYRGGSLCVGAHSPTRYQNAAPVLTNYLAIVGTHYDPSLPSGIVQNGVLVGTDAKGVIPMNRGIKAGEITDGQSNTLMICESREATYASWYDGSTAWTVGQPDMTQAVSPATGNVISTGSPAMNYGPDAAHPDRAYFRSGGPYFGLVRRWGPSSMHPGGLINVVFVDDHCQALNADQVDRNVWLHLITRDGGEVCCGDSL